MTTEEILELARAGASLDDQRAALPEGLRDHAPAGIVLRDGGDGRSRYGGTGPTLPETSFIAAVDLAELPRLEPLPSEGTLNFYYDFEIGERPRMDFAKYTRVTFDASPPQVTGGTPLQGLLMPIAGNEHLDDADFDFYDELNTMVYEHQLLGASRDIQGPVLHEVSYWFEQGAPESREPYSEAELRGEGWALLAQFESAGEFMFGDAGAVYYVIPEADLRAGRFERAFGIMQCT